MDEVRQREISKPHHNVKAVPN